MKRYLKVSALALAAIFGLMSCNDFIEPSEYYSTSSEPIFTLVNNTSNDIAWCIPFSPEYYRDTLIYNTAGIIAAHDSTSIIHSDLTNYWAQDVLPLCIFDYSKLETVEDGDGTVYVLFRLSSESYIKTISLTAPEVATSGRRVVIE